VRPLRCSIKASQSALPTGLPVVSAVRSARLAGPKTLAGEILHWKLYLGV